MHEFALVSRFIRVDLRRHVNCPEGEFISLPGTVMSVRPLLKVDKGLKNTVWM